MISRKKVIILLLALALVLPGATSALAIGNQFNVGTSFWVTLVYDFAQGDFFNVNQRGEVATKAFTVTAGRTLVVTDVSWTFDGGTAGNTVALQLNLSRFANNTPVFVANTVVNQDGLGGLTQHLTAGLVLTSGGSAKVVPVFPVGVNSTVLILYGFLTS